MATRDVHFSLESDVDIEIESPSSALQASTPNHEGKTSVLDSSLTLTPSPFDRTVSVTSITSSSDSVSDAPVPW